MARGKLIVIEGLDGSGISTQTEFLRTWCQGRGIPVSVTKEPTDGPIGGMVKWVLRHELTGIEEEPLALMFAADRRHHVDREIEPALREGITVICDRFSLSFYAYQMVRVEDVAWLREINSKAPVPDLTIFLEVPPKDCIKRMKSDAWRGADKLQRYETLPLLEAANDNFHLMIPRLQAEGQRIVIVDGTRDINAIGGDIGKEAQKLLGNGRTSRRSSPGSESHQIAAILEAGTVSPR